MSREQRSHAIALIALAASLAQASAFQAAQEPTPAPDPAVAEIIVSLLEQSHDLNGQAPPEARLQMLSRQAELVSHFRPDLAREWASEVMLLSRDAPAGTRTFAEDSAMRVLLRVDPNAALPLLDRLDPEELSPEGAGAPLPRGLLNQVFSQVVERSGVAALPLIEQAADRLGAKGRYPYAALGYAAMDAANLFWRDNQKRAVEILRSVYDPSFLRYTQSPAQFSEDLEFGTMLQVLAGGLPLPLVQPGLHAFVARVLAMDLRKYSLQVQVFTRAGQKVVITDPVDATLTYFGSLLNRDAELVKQLVVQRPALQAGLEATTEANLRSMSFASNVRKTAAEAPSGRNFQRHNDAVALSHINVDAALAQAHELPAEQRDSALLEVARGASGEHPEQAAEIIRSVQHDLKSPEAPMQLNVTSAQVSVAAAQHHGEDLHRLLKQGFELATQIALAEGKNPPGRFTAGLASLVQIGIQNDRELTVAFLAGVPLSPEKAELLLAAADSLASPARLPAGSH